MYKIRVAILPHGVTSMRKWEEGWEYLAQCLAHKRYSKYVSFCWTQCLIHEWISSSAQKPQPFLYHGGSSVCSPWPAQAFFHGSFWPMWCQIHWILALLQRSLTHSCLLVLACSVLLILKAFFSTSGYVIPIKLANTKHTDSVASFSRFPRQKWSPPPVAATRLSAWPISFIKSFNKYWLRIYYGPGMRRRQARSLGLWISILDGGRDMIRK